MVILRLRWHGHELSSACPFKYMLSVCSFLLLLVQHVTDASDVWWLRKATDKPLSCYVCETGTASGCGDYFFPDSVTVLKVAEKCQYCVKSQFMFGGWLVTDRSCSSNVSMPVGCSGDSQTAGGRVCVCESDYCNTASLSSAGLLLLCISQLLPSIISSILYT